MFSPPPKYSPNLIVRKIPKKSQLRDSKQSISSVLAIDWIEFSQILYFEALTPKVTVSQNSVFREVIKVKWDHKVEAVVYYNCDLIRRKKYLSLSTIWRYSGKTAVYKAARGPLSGPDHADTLNSDFQSSDLRENKFLLLKPPSVWYFVMAVLED